MLGWSDLTQDEKDIVSNGCGSKGLIIPIPNFKFKASCDQHDFYYWRGGDDELRRKADDEFLEAMLDDAGKKYALKLWAYIYYHGVRFGTILDKLKITKFWEYRDKPKGRRELNAYIKERVL